MDQNPYEVSADAQADAQKSPKPVPLWRKLMVSFFFGVLTLITGLLTLVNYSDKNAAYIQGAVLASITMAPSIGIAIFAIRKRYRNFYTLIKVAAWAQLISVFLAMNQLLQTVTKTQ